LLGYTGLTGPSMQLDPFKVAEKTEKWVKLSAEKGHPWVVTIDEQTSSDAGVVPDADDFNHNIIRKEVLWGNLMNGGAGAEYYFGYKYPNSDTSCEDFRSRENMFKMSKHALDFFNNNAIPFSTMIPSATSVLSSPRNSTSWLATSDRNYIVVYMRDGGTENVDLTLFPLSNNYNIYWFNPSQGGRLQKGTVTKIRGGSVRSLGLAPTDRDSSDWAVLIRFRCRRLSLWLFLFQWLFQLPQTC
jgi:Putative collagen-binding domain of a collagenase